MPLGLIRRRGGDPVPAEYGAVQPNRRAMPGAQHPSQQIGLFGDVQLSQFPARWEGAQLNCGVNGLSSRLYTPSRSTTYTFQQTQYPDQTLSAQRFGQTYTGPVGPLNVARMEANVVAGQVRQSGLAALSWARKLTPQA